MWHVTILARCTDHSINKIFGPSMIWFVAILRTTFQKRKNLQYIFFDHYQGHPLSIYAKYLLCSHFPAISRNLPTRMVNLQLAIICVSWIFSARKLSHFNPPSQICVHLNRLIKVIKITQKYISFIHLYLFINNWYNVFKNGLVGQALNWPK